MYYLAYHYKSLESSSVIHLKPVDVYFDWMPNAGQLGKNLGQVWCWTFTHQFHKPNRPTGKQMAQKMLY